MVTIPGGWVQGVGTPSRRRFSQRPVYCRSSAARTGLLGVGGVNASSRRSDSDYLARVGWGPLKRDGSDRQFSARNERPPGWS